MTFRGQFYAVTHAVESLKQLERFSEFLKKAFGTAPQDVVELLDGDGLKVRRAQNLARIFEKTIEILEARGIDALEPASPSIVLPILVAAATESGDERQDIWARLLAAAADPLRAQAFRHAFTEKAKQMDPMDVAVLRCAQTVVGPITETKRNDFADQLHASRDEVDISIANLARLELVTAPVNAVSPFGREFLRVVLE
jgi:hypothetical protein